MQLLFNTSTAKLEDGGHALILELCNDDGTGSYTGDDLSIKIHSWREEDKDHPDWLKSLVNKKVKLTIEEGE